MREVSGLLVRLNMSTRHCHAEVDEPWLELLRESVSRADYLGQLVRTYGFVAPFESACMYTPGLTRVLDVYQLTRAGLIAQDLLALGLSASQIASIPQCGAITTFRDVAEALGWIYVVERSTLLHEGVHRHVVAELPEVAIASSYLTAYEGRAGERWSMFGRQVDRIGSRPEVADEIISSAHVGFACAKQWLRSTRAHLAAKASA